MGVSRIRVKGFDVQGLGLRVLGVSGFQGLGFRAMGVSGIGVQGFGSFKD